jgi:hypothetical protein
MGVVAMGVWGRGGDGRGGDGRVGSRALVAPQSETTSPSKPHSFLSTSVSSQLFSEQYEPLIWLYADMI